MAALSLFILIALFYFYPLLSCRLIFTERDLAPFFIPPKLLWAGLVKSLEVPLWNPYNFSGIPLLGTLQPGVFYPPHLLYLALPFNVVWNWVIILHFPFAAVTLYALMRYLGAGKQASFVSGLLFMLSGYLISVHNLLPHLLSVGWLPLVLLFYLKYFETARVRHLVYSSLCLTMEYMAGAPEIVIMNLLVLLVITFFVPAFIGEEGPSPWTGVKALGTVFVLFVLLSAIQLLPFVELKMWSIRRAGLAYNEAIVWSFGWKDFIQFFVPDPYGYFTSEQRTWQNQSWLKTVYWGMGPFILSSFYFLRRDGKQLFFLILIVISFLLALGGNTPLYQWLYRVPPFDSMRYPVKYLVIFFFMVSMTAGFGLETLKDGVEERSEKTKRTVGIIFYAGFAFALLWGYMMIFEADVRAFFERMGFVPMNYNFVSTNVHNIERFLLFAFLMCVGMIFYLRLKARRWVLLAVIALIGVDLFCANYRFFQYDLWTSYREVHRFVPFLAENPASRYLYTPRAAGEFKLYPHDRLSLSPSYASSFKVGAIDGAEVFKTVHQDYFLHLLEKLKSLDQAKRYFTILGVSHLVTSYRIENDADFHLLARVNLQGEKEAFLYAYDPFRGRFFVYHRSRSVPGDERIKATLSDPGFDPEKELVIEGPESGGRSFRTGRDLIKTVSLKARSVTVDTESETDGFLYASDTFYPGWRVSLDGKPGRIERANLAFRAVFLPRGSHRVVFRYEPFSFYAGMAITLLGMVLCSVLILKDKWGWRTKPEVKGRKEDGFWKDVLR